MRVEISEAVFKTAGVGSAVLQVASGASVQVNIRGGSAATVYSAATGAGTLSNPLTTDANGRIEGWLDEGSYDLVVSGAGLTTYTERFEAVAGTVGSGYAELNVRDYMADGLAPNGGGGTNATTAINNALAAASALRTSRSLTSVRLGGFGNATFMVDALIHQTGVHLDLGEARLLRRAAASAPMIRNLSSAYGTHDTQKITGGTFDTNGFGSTGGNAIQLWFCGGLTLEGVTVILNQASNPVAAICVGGRNGKVLDCDVLGGTQVFEGGIWLIHGQFWKVVGCHVETGDDCYTIENDPGSAQMVAAPDPLRYITLQGNTGKSERGHLLRILVDASQGAVSSPNWEITDVTVDGLTGTSGRLANGGIRIEDESATATQLVKRVDVSGLELAAGGTTHDDAAITYGVHIDNCYDVTVQGNIEVTQKTAVTNGWGLAKVLDSDDVSLDLNCNSLARLGVDLETASRAKLRGRMRCTSLTTLSPVLLKNAPDVDYDMTVLDVPNGINAITDGTGSTTTSGRIGGKITHAAGATTGRPFNFTVGRIAHLVFDGYDWSGCAQQPDIITLPANQLVIGDGRGFTASKVTLYDDFFGDLLADEWSEFHGSDGAALAPVILAETNGVVKLQYGAGAGVTMAVNGCQLQSGLNWKRSKGGLLFEANVCLSGGAATATCLFVGFTDQVAALEMPFTLAAGDALTSNATDAVGVLYDTAADTDNWWAVGVATDVDATKQNLGLAPAVNTYERWRVDLTSAGTAFFYRNGVAIGSAMTGACGNVDLTPVVVGFSRAAADRSAKVDLIRCEQYR